MGRGEVPESHRDIRVIGVLLSQRIETLWFSKSRERILAVDLGRTRVNILRSHQDIGGIGILQVERTETF
jgi:hypothetical protein